MLDYTQCWTEDNAAVASRSVKLHLLSDITPAFKAKTWPCNLKLASIHLSYQQGNHQFRGGFSAGQLFQLFKSPSSSGPQLLIQKQSWFTETCLFVQLACDELKCMGLIFWGGKGRKALARLGFPVHLGILYKRDRCPSRHKPALLIWSELNLVPCSRST